MYQELGGRISQAMEVTEGIHGFYLFYFYFISTEFSRCMESPKAVDFIVIFCDA